MAALQAHGINVPGFPVAVGAGQIPIAQPVTETSNVAGTTSTADPAGRLQHLTMLRDSGLLSPEEFETLRQKLQGG